MPGTQKRNLKRLPLPKRFNAALSEKAYERLRALNADWHYGNNYLLTILLENFDEIVDADRFEAVMKTFIADYGQPEGGGMTSG
ncbi:hypothetical protein [Roseibium sp. M-1]